jgi:predicted RNA-binding protein YlxR (DUF448 family)
LIIIITNPGLILEYHRNHIYRLPNESYNDYSYQDAERTYSSKPISRMRENIACYDMTRLSKKLIAGSESHNTSILNSRAGSIQRRPRHKNSHSTSTYDVINPEELSLPAISEFRSATTLKEKQGIYINKVEVKENESLLKSLRYLQQDQDYSTNTKTKTQASSFISHNRTSSVRPHNRSCIVESKPKTEVMKKLASKDTNTLICRFTKDRYIRDVYIKHKVPDFDKKSKRKRTKKATKIRKINRSQIKVLKSSTISQLSFSKC